MTPSSPCPALKRSLLAAALLLAAQAGAAKGQPASAGPVTVLDGSGVWRVLHSWNAPLVEETGGAGERVRPLARPDFRFMTQHPPAGWTRVDFDDSTWCRRHFFVKYANGETDARAGGGSASPCLRQLTLRGKFTVTDPAKVRAVHLTTGFRGGAVVYLNGQELTRAHLGDGRPAPGSPAEAYSIDVYISPKRKPWNWYRDRDMVARKSYPFRVRRIEHFAVPSRRLRKGTNVLAMEIHAAPWPAAFARPKWVPSWATCGLVEVRLQAFKAEGIVPNVVRPKGLQVWNANVLADLYDADWGDPHEPLRPIVLAGARNGSYTGRVVLSSDRPIESLQARVRDLSGPGGGKIPASAVRVSFGAFRGAGSVCGAGRLLHGQFSALRDDALLDAPPPVVPARSGTPGYAPVLTRFRKARLADGLPPDLVGGAVQPVYVTVRIPKDAPAGKYSGVLAITAKGEKPVDVPVEVSVIGWTLPGARDFAYWFGLLQSPEGVGLACRVPLWSPKHWELIDKSFAWVADLGSRVVLLPLTAETEYGNAQSMVVWIRQPGGGYTHDFSRVEKYLDVALKHVTNPRFIVAGVWQFCEHKGSPRISIADAPGGEITNIDGPRHGSGESLEFWRPVLTKLHGMLAKRGLGKAMLLGYISDRLPDKATVGVFHQILPEVGWQGQRHWPRGTEYVAYDGGRKPVLYQSNVWGCGSLSDPGVRRVYGWKYTDGVPGGVRTWLDRSVYDRDTLTAFRGMSENILLSNRPGQGQIGADFWPPPPARKGARPLGSLYSRFPRARNVGAGNKGLTTNQLLYPAAGGPVPTGRYEMIREGIQECEARIFLEKLLTARPCRLPPELARRCQDVLDERSRWQRMQKVAFESHLSWPWSGWEKRTAALYQAAHDAAKAMGK